MKRLLLLIPGLIFITESAFSQMQSIPLPEHPRPDFMRDQWVNLNGWWEFQFDKDNSGRNSKWYDSGQEFGSRILVPFPWGSPLSKVAESGDIGWYRREIRIPEEWEGKRIFLVIGASDWHTSVWLEGNYLGEHQGGYTPFEFELTSHVKFGQLQRLVIRVDDKEHPFKLYGKQGYGNARGIWQTPYLEARGKTFIKYIHVTPDIDSNIITLQGELEGEVGRETEMALNITGDGIETKEIKFRVNKNQQQFSYDFPFPEARLWTLEDPFLYEFTAYLESGKERADRVDSYFGFRKISVMDVPGTDIAYVALNNKPIYLQMSLDQAYHPEGFYTFPSDEFMRDEIIRSKKIGLNGQRIHVKIGIPRKLYWADKLGMLIMADVPNSWGEPDQNMRKEIEYALRQMIRRDYNHPSIFSWVIFNETWGLFTKTGENQREYLPETQQWVSDMYQLAKNLDPTRLVEDNSACNYDHVATDLNTWHAYLPGYAWDERLDTFSENTFPGSSWNFAKGYKQAGQPNINSECGNVWGYSGSTGDVDWSWDYHIMINAFRNHPKIGGWLYTEHHDVINEWNGYYRYDRSEKFTGLESFNGMTLNDLHQPIQITPDIDLCVDVSPGQTVEVPLWLSAFTDRFPAKRADLTYSLRWINSIGDEKIQPLSVRTIQIQPWSWGTIDPIQLTMPEEEGLAVLNLVLSTDGGVKMHKNFTTFRIRDPENKDIIRSGNHFRITFPPASFSSQDWSLKHWDVLDGLKVNGAGYGHFTYELDIPEEIASSDISSIILKLEVSAKKLHGKDREDAGELGGDYMRGKGTFDPSRNPNAYPMTDEKTFSSLLRMYVNGQIVDEFYLPDDPADHRGVLSWHAQLKDRKLREAGSYGYLLETVIPDSLLHESLKDRKLKIRFEVPASYAGGMAIYGKDFGRYPLDPTLIFLLK
jgi:hypothetical protein